MRWRVARRICRLAEITDHALSLLIPESAIGGLTYFNLALVQKLFPSFLLGIAKLPHLYRLRQYLIVGLTRVRIALTLHFYLLIGLSVPGIWNTLRRGSHLFWDWI